MNTQDNIRAESHKDPAQLEREIDQKRGNIEQLVSALENRLSPGEIFDRMMRNGGGKQFASNLADTVKANPVPALLTAAGLLWLYSGRNDSPTTRSASYGSSYGSTTTSPYGASASTYGADEYSASSGFDASSSESHGMRDKLHSARDKISSAGSRIGEGTHNAASSVRHRASSAGQSVRHGASRASDSMQRMLHENPMAAAGIGIAVGALLGALVPSTRKEDEWLGEHSDRLTGKAKEFARTGADTLKDASREVTSSGGGASQQASSASTAPVTPSATAGASASAGSSASSGAASRPH